MRLMRGLSWLVETIGVHLIEAQAAVQRQLIGEAPLVLHIARAEPAELATRIGHGERRIGGGFAIDVERFEDRGHVHDPASISPLTVKARAQRVRQRRVR